MPREGLRDITHESCEGACVVSLVTVAVLMARFNSTLYGIGAAQAASH